MSDTTCEKCGEWIAEYGQGLSHKCSSIYWCTACREVVGHKCKTVGEKAEEIAECVANGGDIDKVSPNFEATKINDGGPAFPSQEMNFNLATEGKVPGMSLRDWFAGMALQGLVSNMIQASFKDSRVSEAFSIISYDLADNMLKAGSK